MKAIRLRIKQSSANYRREETVKCRMTYPLPPYSTVIGAIHKACGYTSYHPMRLSIQGQYGSIKNRLFKEDCFLNSLQDDRGILVKLKNPDMLSSAYQIVAAAQKSQGNSFEKGITINVLNQDLLDEYRFLNRTKRRIDKHKKLVKLYKDKLKEMKNNPETPEDELKAFAQRVKSIDKAYKRYEDEKYTKPKSHFKTLTKAPKWCELLCDVELVIHIVSDEKTMQDILDNCFNLTAIGRGEDFVQLEECVETELIGGDISYFNDDFANYAFYFPLELFDKNKDAVMFAPQGSGLSLGGTKYLLKKEYETVQISGGYRKRIFNKVPVLYTKQLNIDGHCEGIFLDADGEKKYAVCLV
ncbi:MULTISPECIES: CRISPR-associated protein Cas5 [unclassified Ruminococcus]|uniref:CRISPR-associated protein Cas5 n=1 Tax=unclassified Ruminococcus TaxID=2608920 RepID=UPI002108B41B|nr:MULTISPECIES: CRISPR-associated protein Cas5 [unclassified Ruminococcus]